MLQPGTPLWSPAAASCNAAAIRCNTVQPVVSSALQLHAGVRETLRALTRIENTRVLVLSSETRKGARPNPAPARTLARFGADGLAVQTWTT